MLRLEFERKQRRWTQKDVARRVGQILGTEARLGRQPFVSRAELSQLCLSDEELEALATLFEVRPAFLLLRHVEGVQP